MRAETETIEPEQLIQLVLTEKTAELVTLVTGHGTHGVQALVDAIQMADRLPRLELISILATIAVESEYEAGCFARDQLFEQCNARKRRLAKDVLRVIEAGDQSTQHWLRRVGVDEDSISRFPNWDSEVISISSVPLDAHELANFRMIRRAETRNGIQRKASVQAATLGLLILHDVKLSDDDLIWLRGLRVRGLDLSATQVTGRGLNNLKIAELQYVRLDDCPVSDESLREIDIPTLVELYLNRTKITGQGLQNIRPAKIQQLMLFDTQISSDDLGGLTRFPMLNAVRVNAELL
ncbi:MAG: hypothetical protein KDA59_23805, partial [Planctomycetales bacterium]|nr:hypothetical protein [Planctomycetales bacterium]